LPVSDAELLFDVVREAGELGKSLAQADVKRWSKPDGSQVTEADLKINELFEQRLKPRRDYGWLSEESPDDDVRLNFQRLWIIDPIDGTRAFIERKKEWCVAAALVEDGRPVAAAVYRPMTEEFFSAVQGEGAFLNGERLSMADPPSLEGARLAGNRKALSQLSHAGIQPDYSGALPIQLRLAGVAAGWIDGAVSAGNRNDWDLAAGELLVFEAGGLVSNTSGDRFIYNRREPWQQGLVAAGARRHAAIIEHLRTE
jgi:myo-inositol-1(or 4)-monophosphatase